MAWISLTRDDLRGRLSKPELQRLPDVARASGITAEQLLAAAIDEVVREVRGYVAVHNTLGPSGTLPDELENAALALIRRVIFGRVPGVDDLFGDIRKSEVADAQSLLRRVATAQFRIVAPESPAPQAQQAGAASPSIMKRPLAWTMEDQDGL